MPTPQQQLVNNYYGKNVDFVSAYDKHLLRKHYKKMIDTLYDIEREEEDCECGNNKEKGLVNSQMRCEDCDIDGMNYNGGLTDEEEEEVKPS